MLIPDDIIDHLARVWGGEYDLTITKDKLTVLDLGANVGAFAFWALVKWPDCQITCIEPLPANYDLLQFNLKGFGTRCALNQLAVGKDNDPKRKFFIGKHNCGEGSFYQGQEQSETSIEVETISASVIPHHDIVKIDVEGAEIEILENLKFKPYAYLIEYHTAANRRRILELLGDDYILLGHKIYQPGTGIMKFAKAETVAL